MSKAFNDRLKPAVGFAGDQYRRKVMHSIRGTVTTTLERAAVDEGTVQDIIGMSEARSPVATTMARAPWM